MSLREGLEEPFCGFQLSQIGAAALLDDATIPCSKFFLFLLLITLVVSLLELKLRDEPKSNDLLFPLKGWSGSFDIMKEGHECSDGAVVIEETLC